MLSAPAAQAQLETNGQTLLQFEADRVSVRETAAALSLSIRPTAPLSDRAVFGLFVDPLDGANPNTLSSLETQIIIEPGDESVEINLLINDNADLSGDQSYAIQLFPLSLGSNQGILTPSATLCVLLMMRRLPPPV